MCIYCQYDNNDNDNNDDDNNDDDDDDDDADDDNDSFIFKATKSGWVCTEEKKDNNLKQYKNKHTLSRQ